MPAGQGFDDQKAGVVTRVGVLGAGVAEADDEQLDRLPRRRRATRAAGRERLLLGLGLALAHDFGLGRDGLAFDGLFLGESRRQH